MQRSTVRHQQSLPLSQPSNANRGFVLQQQTSLQTAAADGAPSRQQFVQIVQNSTGGQRQPPQVVYLRPVSSSSAAPPGSCAALRMLEPPPPYCLVDSHQSFVQQMQLLSLPSQPPPYTAVASSAVPASSQTPRFVSYAPSGAFVPASSVATAVQPRARRVALARCGTATNTAVHWWFNFCACGGYGGSNWCPLCLFVFSSVYSANCFDSSQQQQKQWSYCTVRLS
uniref:Uncharacterized protein n=1 Tax=Macrostomum lignano TaxID=282301 RepID=A0A1I8GRN1_9PLAT